MNTKLKTHRERAAEAAESWEDHLDYPLEGVWRSEDTTNLADLVEISTYPVELVEAAKAMKGVFDTPVMRRLVANEYANDARKRLRDALDLYKDKP